MAGAIAAPLVGVAMARLVWHAHSCSSAGIAIALYFGVVIPLLALVFRLWLFGPNWFSMLFIPLALGISWLAWPFGEGTRKHRRVRLRLAATGAVLLVIPGVGFFMGFGLFALGASAGFLVDADLEAPDAASQ